MISAGSSARVRTAAKSARHGLHAGVEILRARCRTVDAVHGLQVRQIRANLRDLAQAARIGDQDCYARILQPVAQGIDPEQGKQGHDDRAGLVGRDMRNGGFGLLRQQDADAIARAQTAPNEQIGRLVGQAL